MKRLVWAAVAIFLLATLAFVQILLDLLPEFQEIKQASQEERVFKEFVYNEAEVAGPLLEVSNSLVDFAASVITQPVDASRDYEDVSRRLNLLKGLYRDNENTELFTMAFRQLFPWIQTEKPTGFLDESFERGSSGILIAVGNEFTTCAIHAIRAIRALNCTLPMTIAYSGLFDLLPESRRRFTSFNVEFIDICERFNCTEIDPDRWDTKPFTLLASPYENTILMDADTVFVQSPERLFRDPGYQRTGALFFHDRTLYGGNYDLSQWIASVLPKPISERVKASRIFRAQSYYEQESGVVVMNKAEHLFGLLSICYLNTPEVRDPIRANTHGEKETFWMGLEVANEPYEFMPGMPGSIGRIETKGKRVPVQEICGHLAHFDREGALLWFNDGLASAKKESDEYAIRRAAELSHFGREGRWTETLCLRGDLLPVDESIRTFIRDLQFQNELTDVIT
jgi:hypothetical protein